MIKVFLITLWVTFVIIRIGVHYFHDEKNYGTKKEHSETPTYWLRKETKLNIHHIHIGFLLLLINILLIIFIGFTIWIVVLVAISLSLIADQLIPFLYRRRHYFKLGILESIVLHIIISFIVLISRIS